jgi:uncharacterized membrane protein HdeD (DUF308 family)
MEQTRFPIDETVDATWLSISTALGLIVLGAVAALLPVAVGVAVSMLILWIIVFSGVAHLIHAWDVRDSALFYWRLAVGVIYIAGGIYLLQHPGYGIIDLSRFLAAMFALEALLLLAAAYLLRRLPGNRWMTADGALTLLFAALILFLTPWSTGWELGLIVGMNILFSGFVYLALLRSGGLRLPTAGSHRLVP